MADPFLDSHFLKDKSPECQLLEGRDHALLISAAQCPMGLWAYHRGLCKCWSKRTKLSENVHPPTGVKAIPWNKIVNQILNFPAWSLAHRQHRQVHPWASYARPHVLSLTTREPLYLWSHLPPPLVSLLMPQECWAPHKWDAVLPHMALPMAIPLLIASPPLCHQTNSFFSFWNYVPWEAVSEPPGCLRDTISVLPSVLGLVTW